MLGPGARFREHQFEAIVAVVEGRQRLLLVERTGWGKSLVYFIATRLLREQGAGPALLISPLLALMRNQIQMAERIGIRAVTIHSANTDEWQMAENALSRGTCDIVLISPERLSNERFRLNVLPRIRGAIGLLVVDEVHCISDWGHDFRPDYRRIVRIVQALPRNVPVIGTTATANDRVVADVVEQLGPSLIPIRGALTRRSLHLQAIRLADQAERLAWLAEHVPRLPGSGIIYCLTVADTRRVATWLQQHGIKAEAYNAALDNASRERLEQLLLTNRVKALIATVALGMGFDKPDLGFVIHYQRPGSIVAYYQQVGRAGRAVEDAYAILLHGSEDDEIQEYFIESAFPRPEAMTQVLQLLEDSEGGLTSGQLLRQTNLSLGTVERALKLLEIDGAVSKTGTNYFRTLNPWSPDVERMTRVTAQRYQELQQMQAFVDYTGCLMQFVAQALDDETAQPCGRCANCVGDFAPRTANRVLVQEAVTFLRRDFQIIEPRKLWPAGGTPPYRGSIPATRRLEPGRALCIYGDAGWGRLVRDGKYRHGRFSDELVEAAAEMIRKRWQPSPAPLWVTAIPSKRHPTLVPNVASRLAAALQLSYRQVLAVMSEWPQQKDMRNSAQQANNVLGALRVDTACSAAPVLLVDDIVDSRWTLTVAGYLLREAGVTAVHPFALAVASGSAGDTQ
jgi:ATP-dependent DNA helicase RecQ